MSYTLHIDVEHRFLRQTWQGALTAPALIDLWKELADDPRGLASFDTLIDLRAATLSLSTSDVVYLANVARHQPPSRRAIVAANDADFGVMRMLELRSEPGAREYAVFRTIEKACGWLANPACSD